MDQNTIIHLAISGVIIILVVANSASLGIFTFVMIGIALLAAIVVLLLSFADYLVFPAITRLFKINTIPFKNHMIPPDQDAVVKYVNGVYYATGFLTANIYNYVFAAESVGEDQGPLILAPERWEKATMNIHFPFKFTLYLQQRTYSNTGTSWRPRGGFTSSSTPGRCLQARLTPWGLRHCRGR